jgi:hypothetical protein
VSTLASLIEEALLLVGLVAAAIMMFLFAVCLVCGLTLLEAWEEAFDK